MELVGNNTMANCGKGFCVLMSNANLMFVEPFGVYVGFYICMYVCMCPNIYIK